MQFQINKNLKMHDSSFPRPTRMPIETGPHALKSTHDSSGWTSLGKGTHHPLRAASTALLLTTTPLSNDAWDDDSAPIIAPRRTATLSK